MNTVTYHKPPLSVDDQVQLLVKRGMMVADTARVKHFLTHINYYRLRAYWLPFEINCREGHHEFQPGTSFDSVIAIYSFDREMRMLVMDAIERFEIALRAQWAHYLSIKYGAFCHTDKTHFDKSNVWQCCLDKLNEEYYRSKETFAAHYRNNYRQLMSPPIWVACELFSFGHLSRWLGNLKLSRDRQAIADTYGLDEKVLTSFTHHLTVVRNHCAHHGRLWNRKFAVKMKTPTKKPALILNSFNRAGDGYLYNTLTMLAYVMNLISPDSTWASRVKTLVPACRDINVADMGFPPDWLSFYPWNIVG